MRDRLRSTRDAEVALCEEILTGLGEPFEMSEPTPRQPTRRFDAGENAMMRGIAAADQHDLQTGLKW